MSFFSPEQLLFIQDNKIYYEIILIIYIYLKIYLNAESGVRCVIYWDVTRPRAEEIPKPFQTVWNNTTPNPGLNGRNPAGFLLRMSPHAVGVNAAQTGRSLQLSS